MLKGKKMDEDEQELPEKVDRVLSKIQQPVHLPNRRPPYDVFFRVKRRGLRRAPRVRADEIAHAQVQRRELPPQPVGFGVLAQSVQPPDGSPSRGSAVKARAATRAFGGVFAGPQPDTEEEGSALDFPEEYVRAVPSRRPDIFPDLKEPKTPIPKPMPGDPEVPDEEEEEERKKNPGEPGTDPDEDEDEENPSPRRRRRRMNEGVRVRASGAGGDVVATSVIRRRRCRFNALHIVEVHNLQLYGVRARQASRSRNTPSRASLLLSCLAFMFSSTSFATGTYLVSGARARGCASGALHLSGAAPAIQLQLFQRRARAQVELGERVGPDHQRLDGAHFSRFNALRFRHCSSALSASRTSGSSGTRACPTARARIEARRNATRPRRAAAGTPRRASTKRVSRGEPRNSMVVRPGGESFTTSAGKASCRVFVCVTRICGRFGEGRARSARRVRRAREGKKVPGLGSGSISDVETARVRERHDVPLWRSSEYARAERPMSASQTRPATRPPVDPTPRSPPPASKKRRTTLEDGSLGSERGNDSERRARERVRTRSHPGSCRGSAVAFPDLAGALSLAIPRARRLALAGCAEPRPERPPKHAISTKTKFKQFFFGAVAKSIRRRRRRPHRSRTHASFESLKLVGVKHHVRG